MKTRYMGPGARRGLLLLSGYFLLAQLGMWLAVPPLYAASVWPATGLAVYCLLAWGHRYWPWVWLGAFGADLLHKTVVADNTLALPLVAATAITAVGSALTALVATSAMARVVARPKGHVGERRVLRGLFLAGPVACSLTATLGVGSLYFLLDLPAASLAGNWLTWWMADCLGLFMFAPFMLRDSFSSSVGWRRHFSKPRVLPLLVILLVALTFHALGRAEHREFQQQIASSSGLLQEYLEQGLRELDEVVQGTADFILSAEEVTPAEFATFTRRVQQRKAIQGLAWAPAVSAGQRREFETTESRRLGQAAFSITEHDGRGNMVTAGDRDRYYPLQLVNVFDGQMKAVGYDLGSEPDHADRLQAAISNGHPLLLDRHAFYGEDMERRDDWRYFLPLYHPDLPVESATTQERERAFIGFVVGVIYFEPLFERVRHSISKLGLDFCVTLQATDDTAPLLLVDTRQPLAKGGEPDWRSMPVWLGDAQLNIASRASRPWHPAQSVIMKGFVVVAVFGTLLITAYIIIIEGQQVRISRQIKSRTRSLKQAQQELADILNNMTSYVIELDHGGHVVRVNKALRRAYGQSEYQLRGRHVSRTPWFAELGTAQASVLEDIRAALRGARVRRDLKLHRPGGQPFWVNYSLTPVFGDGHCVTKLIVSAIDITARKRVEDKLQVMNHSLEVLVSERTRELQQLTEQLEERVSERTAQLQLARQEAERANQSKSYFLASMSHEIRTPLNGVVGMLDVLARTELSRSQHDMLTLIRQSALSLTELINAILEFSKIESGKIDIARENISIAGLVAQTCNLLDLQAREQGVELTLFIDPALPRVVLGDSLRLRQILVNLVGNAIKFSRTKEPGKVSVRATLSGSRFSLAIVRLDVADNGIGIEADAQAGIFEAFAQADTSRIFGGTGLGLTITRHLVTLLGGDIGLQSEPGVGTCFTVSLPFEPVATEAGESVPDFPLRGLPCLVIGEEGGIAQDLLCYLRHEQAQVDYAPDMEAATRMSSHYPAGLCIWIYDATRQRFPVADLKTAARSWPEHDIRFVVLERGARRHPRQVADNYVMLDANVLKREALALAVAGAAGRVTLPGRDYASEKVFPPVATLADGTHHALILVAEDNEVNQKVIRYQLSLLGHDVHIAANGLEALRRWRSQAYDLLITDLNMPEMDGYQLTQQIRREEQEGVAMPIVALTANAFKEEVSRCFEAGMSDYLSKPMQLEQLQAVLERWLPGAGIGAVTSRRPAGAAEAQKTLDLDVFRGLIGDDKRLQHELLGDYRYSLQEQGDLLTTACKSKDHGRMGELAHTLKSSSRAVGALGLADLLEELEWACQAAGEMPTEELVAAIEREMTQVMAAVDEALG